MRRTSIALTLVILYAALSLTGIARAGQPKTARELFLEIPTDYFTTPVEKRGAILSADSTDDHVRFTESVEGEDSWGEARTFIRKDNVVVVVLVVNFCTPGTCGGFLQTLTYDNGKWSNITLTAGGVVDFEALNEELLKKAEFEASATDGVVPVRLELDAEGLHYVAGKRGPKEKGPRVRSFKWNGLSFEPVK
jgi:hypothetical protein